VMNQPSRANLESLLLELASAPSISSNTEISKPFSNKRSNLQRSLGRLLWKGLIITSKSSNSVVYAYASEEIDKYRETWDEIKRKMSSDPTVEPAVEPRGKRRKKG
jgi:predicted transcriptional regulator